MAPQRESKTRARTKIENDDQSDTDWATFCTRAIEQFKRHNAGDIYVWTASGPNGITLQNLLVSGGYHWGATIIWNKQHFVLSRANYMRNYEPCFYGWIDKSSFNFPMSSKGADRTQSDVWEIDRPMKSTDHPTMKPIPLCERAILNSSEEGDLVLDLFGGSGSTLIACENTDRRCYMMEIDPGYCDVIVKRWEDTTGKKAERLKG